MFRPCMRPLDESKYIQIYIYSNTFEIHIVHSKTGCLNIRCFWHQDIWLKVKVFVWQVEK